jgi:hypothetical protein
MDYSPANGVCGFVRQFPSSAFFPSVELDDRAALNYNNPNPIAVSHDQDSVREQ